MAKTRRHNLRLSRVEMDDDLNVLVNRLKFCRLIDRRHVSVYADLASRAGRWESVRIASGAEYPVFSNAPV